MREAGKLLAKSEFNDCLIARIAKQRWDRGQDDRRISEERSNHRSIFSDGWCDVESESQAQAKPVSPFAKPSPLRH